MMSHSSSYVELYEEIADAVPDALNFGETDAAICTARIAALLRSFPDQQRRRVLERAGMIAIASPLCVELASDQGR